jgi:dATP pyrophosphohydrolase
MARQPFQVHIYLYRINPSGKYEYAIFQRSDNSEWWQGICGGMEEGETLEESARRELYEEAGISDDLPIYPLDTHASLPVSIFFEERQKRWGKDLLIVPMYFYAMPFEGEITLSDEHINVRWLTYDKAYELVSFSDQKVALWELNERLKRGNLKRNIKHQKV